MKLIRNLLKNLLLTTNSILSRPPGQFSIEHLRLENARRLGLTVSMAVDIGAADGNWTRGFKKIFPASTVLCIEPRADAQPKLLKLKSELSGIHVCSDL